MGELNAAGYGGWGEVPQERFAYIRKRTVAVMGGSGMRQLILVGLLVSGPALAESAESLCAQNPAFSPTIMLKIVQAQLEADHDPSLEADTPENVAKQASVQGIAECAAEMRADPSIMAALGSLSGADLQVGWDAFNTACADHKASRGACITAEVQSDKALKRMISTDSPAGAKALVQTCELVMQTDPPLAEWRECVDQGLAVHASGAAAKRCKLSATWHVAKTGAEAGGIVAACLKGG
jgi:hypothetical protein